MESLARPGGNATGPSFMMTDLSGKRLSLLKDAVPNLSRVALLIDTTDPFNDSVIKSHQAASHIHSPVNARDAERREWPPYSRLGSIKRPA